MQERCNNQAPLCQCVDWHEGDLSVQINHIIDHFEFVGFELQDTDLEPEDAPRLCKIGRCRLCGRRLCLGVRLTRGGQTQDFIQQIYTWMRQVWNEDKDPLPPGVESLDDMFLSLFQGKDRETASRFLSAPKGPCTDLMCCGTEKEGC